MERKAIFIEPSTHQQFKELAVKVQMTFNELLIYLLEVEEETRPKKKK